MIPMNSHVHIIIAPIAKYKLNVTGILPSSVSLMLIVPQRIINRKVPSRNVKIPLKKVSFNFFREYILAFLQLRGQNAKTANNRMTAI